MYIGGCPLERHWNNAAGDTAAYTYRKIVDGVRTETKEMTLGRALGDEEWDIVTLQQASGKSGRYVTYQPYLRDLIAYVTRLGRQSRAEDLFPPDVGLCRKCEAQESSSTATASGRCTKASC